MEKMSYDELYTKAVSLKANGVRWHFHTLDSGCTYNKHKGHYVFILENEETGEVWYSLFNRKPLPEAKKLADLSYGEGFLEQGDATSAEEEANPQFEQILARAETCIEKSIDWHNHHLYPNCIFNPSKGKHSIVFEDAETPEPMVAVYDGDPMRDLAAIERLLFRDLTK